MPRPRKTDSVKAEEQTEVQSISEVQSEETVEQTEVQSELPQRILDLMRLYPQYEKVWITKRGFVHPADVPEYLRKDATLYTNEFYNK